MPTGWQFKSDWLTAPRNPDYPDLQNLMLDQGRAGVSQWGGDVDAGGHSLLNLDSVASTGVLRLFAGGAERARITATGRLGVGITAPGAILQVQSSSDELIGRFYQAKNNGGSANVVEVLDDRAYSGANSGSALTVKSWSGYGNVGAILNVQSIDGGVTNSRLIVRQSGIVRISNLPQYANNDAAISGGLVSGELYSVAGSNPRQVAVVF